MISRRTFHKCLLTGGGAFVARVWASGNLPPVGEQRSRPDCDLLLKGGTVIDPGQGLHAPMDVAIKDGKISDLSSNCSDDRARNVVSVRGKIVTPGFVDLHAHCFDGFGGVNADHYCLGRGVTTVVDCGSAGYPMIGGLMKYVVRGSSTRIVALVDIGELGTVFGTKDAMKDLDFVNPKLTAKAAEENKPTVVGIKVRLQKSIEGTNDLECLRRALEAAAATNLPLMAHISDPYSPLPDILKLMRKGDIFTHIYNDRPNGILDANGRILPEVIEARHRGIIFDPAHGRSHFSFQTAEKALQQGFLPDTISTDLSLGNVDGPVYDLPTTVSKFLALGMNLDMAIERVTIAPAKVFDYRAQLGTLKPGTEANCAVFEVQEGSFQFVDSEQKTRIGRQRLVNKAVVCRGQLLINQI